MNDKRNPSNIRGDGEILQSYADRMASVIEKLEWQSEGHRMWYTHKNPYGCWICELLQVARQCQSELVDAGQHSASNQDNGSETDIN